jgi:hypothetical protein
LYEADIYEELPKNTMVNHEIQAIREADKESMNAHTQKIKDLRISSRCLQLSISQPMNKILKFRR